MQVSHCGSNDRDPQSQLVEKKFKGNYPIVHINNIQGQNSPVNKISGQNYFDF